VELVILIVETELKHQFLQYGITELKLTFVLAVCMLSLIIESVRI